MSLRPGRFTIALGVALTAVGLVGAVVYQFQPWRSCPYDDSPAACAMLPQDSTAFLAFVLVLLLGAVILTLSIALRVKAGLRASA